MVTVVSRSNLAEQLTPSSPLLPGATPTASRQTIFSNDAERKIGELTFEAIKRYESLPSSTYLMKDEVQKRIVQEVTAAFIPIQWELPGVIEKPDIEAIVQKASSFVVQQTIDIPRIIVVPKGEVTVGYHPFKLDTSAINYQPVSRDLLIQHLRTNRQETLSSGGSAQLEQRLEDYIVRGLVDFDDISYDDHADLIYDLAGQMVAHLKSYLSESDVRNVLIFHQRQISEFVHAQMQAHQWEKAGDYEVQVTKGFVELKGSAYTKVEGEPICDFRQTVEDKSRIGQMLFGGFERCLYVYQKFQADSERKLAVILDREALKWFKPARGQFLIFYKWGHDQLEYQPDFVAETAKCIYMLEPKARNEMNDADTIAKKEAAMRWCQYATTHALNNSGKPWKYALIPHDSIAENMTVEGLANQFASS